MEAKIEFTTTRLSDIKFSSGDNYLVYQPLEDITGIELAHLLHLFTVASMQSANMGWTIFDYPEFIERKGLMRHFRKEPK